MMHWTQREEENGYCCLSIEASWDEIAADYDDLVARYAASVRLPGFRPGKTPRGAVEQRFQKELIADLSARTVQRFGREAIREAGVEALGPPEASEVDCAKGQPFRARVNYLPMPEIQLPELAGLDAADDGTDPRDRISRRLLELVPFVVPDELVRQELELDGMGDITPGSAAWLAAAERIRLMVILKRIARQEGIEVDDGEVSKRIAEKAQEFRTSAKVLRTELEKEGGICRLREMLIAESTLEYLMEINGRKVHERRTT
jgi:FKBP-type peptidyl-prolyl cis-trans isomerase (trigger factor)